ncbi:thioredoxin domain-containing protein [Patescibacteria group bacterium]|nr:thioredoxin domain-containing protein [Patescibacteria group bacterium]
MEESKQASLLSEKPEEKLDEKDKKIKNLISVVILLSGLFVGSLFVDISQLLSGGGFSLRNLSKTEIFESNGKTWVAYSDPMVSVKIITDEQCEKCNPAEPLVWLRRVVPTISAQKVEFNSEEGQALIEKFSLKTLPAFVFSQTIDQTEFFAQAQALFVPKDGQFELKTQELGLTPGRYLDLPQIKEGDAVFGKNDSSVKMIIFSDFQCPYCKLFHQTLRQAMKAYGNKVAFGFKHLPLSFHAQAEPAALASECANEQNKFWEYGDKLFAAQAEWSAAQGTQKFKDYARLLGLKTVDFNQCLDSKKYQDKIDAGKAEAAGFGISGTPAFFVNSQFNNGVVTLEQLKAMLDLELAK